MPAFLAAFLAREGVQSAWAWIKAHGTLLFIVAFVLVLLGSVAVIYDRGHKAGQEQVTVEAAKQHEQTVQIARHDEQLAQTTSDAVGQKVSAKTAQNHDETLQAIAEMKDELAKAKAAAAKSGPVVATDVVVPDSVRAKSNALIAGANGSADYTGPAK